MQNRHSIKLLPCITMIAAGEGQHARSRGSGGRGGGGGLAVGSSLPPASAMGALARLLRAGVTASSAGCDRQAAGKKRARFLRGAERYAVAGCEGGVGGSAVSPGLQTQSPETVKLIARKPKAPQLRGQGMSKRPAALTCPGTRRCSWLPYKSHLPGTHPGGGCNRRRQGFWDGMCRGCCLQRGEGGGRRRAWSGSLLSAAHRPEAADKRK